MTPRESREAVHNALLREFDSHVNENTPVIQYATDAPNRENIENGRISHHVQHLNEEVLQPEQGINSQFVDIQMFCYAKDSALADSIAFRCTNISSTLESNGFGILAIRFSDEIPEEDSPEDTVLMTAHLIGTYEIS